MIAGSLQPHRMRLLVKLSALLQIHCFLKKLLLSGIFPDRMTTWTVAIAVDGIPRQVAMIGPSPSLADILAAIIVEAQDGMKP